MIDYENLARIEYTVLGTMLTNPACVGQLLADLVPAHFSSDGTKGLFKAIRDLHFAGAPVDAVTVRAKAGEAYAPILDAVLHEWTDDPGYFAGLLRDTSRLVQMQQAASQIATAPDLETALAALERMSQFAVSKAGVSVVSAAEAMTSFYARHSPDAPKPTYLPWGFKTLDQYLRTEPGDMIVIGGQPSSGKTLTSIQMALRMAQDYRVGYYTLETSVSKVVDRAMAHRAQIPLARIKDNDLNDADWASIAEAAHDYAGLQLDHVHAPRVTVQEIQALALQHRHQVIFVDYLQLVDGGGRSRFESVTDVSLALHGMAQSTGITVVALCQLSRPEKVNGKPQPPTMSSLRESGQIEQDADAIMLLWPSDPNDNRSNRILKIAKNKEGPRTKIELELDGPTQTMREAPESSSEHYQRLQREIKQAGKQVTLEELKGEDPELPF